MIKLAGINQVLNQGGLVRFTWNTCTVELIDAAGSSQRIDQRAYASVRNNPNLIETKSGSIDSKNLIIEWHK